MALERHRGARKGFEERDNQFITAGASAHLHTRAGGRDGVVVAFARRSFRILRAVIRDGTNCRAETRCKFPSIALHGPSSRANSGEMCRARLDTLGIFISPNITVPPLEPPSNDFFTIVRSVAEAAELMISAAQNRHVYEFLVFINHRKARGRGSKIGFAVTFWSVDAPRINVLNRR